MSKAPVLSPSLSSSPLPSAAPVSITRTLSSTSVHSLAELLASASTSSASLPLKDGEVEVVTVKGLQHTDIKLQARHYKQSSFATHLLHCLQSLHVPSWSKPQITPSDIQVHKVSGSMTNAVFFVSCPTVRGIRTLLLRIYGPSSGSLISRPRELHTLHVLSSQYHIGPRVYGTFENGRIEEYFDSTTLSADDIRDPIVSRWIGARMAELHSVDIEAIEGTTPKTRGEGVGWEISVKKNVRAWLGFAQDVLVMPAVPADLRKELDLPRFEEDWNKYTRWLSQVDAIQRGSRRVFAHNDTQYGNLLRLKYPKEGTDEHRQIIVVDFEYAAPNPASFDIANHFHEWTANYHSSTPHLLDPSRYPTKEERYNFYIAYLLHSTIFGEDNATIDPRSREAQITDLDQQVRAWSPASHAMWAIWGIVQAREDVEGNVQEPEFDYLSYANCRMAAFRREIAALGL